MPVTFAPGGKPDSYGNRKFPEGLPEYLAGFGLNGFEIECGRGISISDNTYNLLPALSEKHNIYLSVHAPYYISVSSENASIREKSVGYILETARAAKRIKAEKIVVHSGSCSKMSRGEALNLALDTFRGARAALDAHGLEDVIICPETMGKINQLGTTEEVLELCAFDERMIPCVDFGHLNARTHGGIRSAANYAAVFDAVEKKLGFERLRRLHIHFSKIRYTAGGEKKHLTFDEDARENFGPDYEPLMAEIFKRGLNPSVVCESQGTQAEDCAVMAKYYWGLS
ncbi:MAG: TIM barrel protein [Oscillospiraceae bacterium]|jgi:deoxyribonuclease-4|nr:TIM barrel protein [Oscillospiraceae bacterium]